MYDQLPINESDFDLDLELELAYKLNGLENDGDSAPPSGGGVATGSLSGGQQLSMYYAGQVGIFDDVAPEKVKDALYVLGSSSSTAWVEDINAGGHKRMGKGELPGKCSQLHRLASLKRYRRKRMKRCYQKKIMYHVRQQVALSMTRRSNGQFCSNKTLLDDSGLSNSMPDNM